ncbi:O-methyltransferase lepI [Golovinomyces cichoracearum]|uniref:O-methyltransferase lepI n=1 Tax=Golovinomyces cichoracearum TaxID=62708 RepID=A0A420IEB4_9PEZI|nr:O-methyltransferase lepI [Golovinomyces cichoracearum]
MGTYVSKQPAGTQRRTSSIRSRISSKRWPAQHPSEMPSKQSAGNQRSPNLNPETSLEINLDCAADRRYRASNVSTDEIKDVPVAKTNIRLQEPEFLVEQLGALIEHPEKYSSHHRVIARLAHQVYEILEGNCLIYQLYELIEEPQKFAKNEKELTILTRRASTVFENPYQTYHRIAYSGLPLIISRIAQDYNLLKTLVVGDNEAFSVSSLAEISGINEAILEIFLEYMAAQHIIEDTGKFLYKSNNVTKNLLEPIAVNGIPLFDDLLFPIIGCLGDSLKEYPGRNAYQIAFNTTLDLASWLEDSPELYRGVFELIQNQSDHVPSWHDVIDFEEEFASGSDEQSFVFVDIGGGTGNQCNILLEKYPNLKGRVILQEKLARLQVARVPDRVMKVPYDLFSDQHIRGAYVYYIRQVLHQHTDEAVIGILKAQAPAMREDSVLLIDEKVLPDMKIPKTTSLLNVTEMNILMVACFNAFDRRQDQWLGLLDKAGYEVAQIHPYSDLQDCIIVAKLKNQAAIQSPQFNEQSDVFNL